MKHIKRLFFPGSSWVYIKLYTGERTADFLLLNIVYPFIKKLTSNGLIEKWFFVRYVDPEFHIRCRILLHDSNNWGEVVKLFNRKLLNSDYLDFIWKVQIDTYDREIERYGMKFMELSESLFYIDSECILSIIKKIISDNNYRWMVAIKLIDELFSNFGLSILEKQSITKEMSLLLKNKFGFNKYNSKQFNIKYREYKKSIEAIINDSFYKKEFLSVLPLIRIRTNRIKEIIKHKNIEEGNIRNLLISYSHMMMNRLFQSENLKYEMIIYDFMNRYYVSVIVRNQQLKQE